MRRRTFLQITFGTVAGSLLSWRPLEALGARNGPQTLIWTGAVSSDGSDSQNYAEGVAPRDGDTIIIQPGGCPMRTHTDMLVSLEGLVVTPGCHVGLPYPE